jgi:light-harvesting protein B-800-850 beta chain
VCGDAKRVARMHRDHHRRAGPGLPSLLPTDTDRPSGEERPADEALRKHAADAGSARDGSCVTKGRLWTMDSLDDPNRVWPTGLTIKESEALHKHVIDGARIFGAISVVAHFLAYIYSPWLH